MTGRVSCGGLLQEKSSQATRLLLTEGRLAMCYDLLESVVFSHPKIGSAFSRRWNACWSIWMTAIRLRL